MKRINNVLRVNLGKENIINYIKENKNNIVNNLKPTKEDNKEKLISQ